MFKIFVLGVSDAASLRCRSMDLCIDSIAQVLLGVVAVADAFRSLPGQQEGKLIAALQRIHRRAIVSNDNISVILLFRVLDGYQKRRMTLM